ncbi:MAG: NAD-binding protein [Oscillospiraceae bacterium]|nr:NAD-binding protein [Oscillospiraceae bacterium]
MNIMIIGGGNVGYYLTKSLSEEKHRIMIVETDRPLCEQMAADFSLKSIEVTCGDGTDVRCLREAGVSRADVLVAVTGKDQNNLVACQLAKDYFCVKRTITRVKNPKNIRVFEKLGVDVVISSTQRIAGVINQELDWTDVNKLLSERTDNVRLRDIAILPGSPFEHKRLGQLGLPKGVILIAVLRGDEAIIPDGMTELLQGDTVIVWGNGADISRAFDFAEGGVSL